MYTIHANHSVLYTYSCYIQQPIFLFLGRSEHDYFTSLPVHPGSTYVYILITFLFTHIMSRVCMYVCILLYVYVLSVFLPRQIYISQEKYDERSCVMA